jgi:ATP-binding cassette subfamily B protein
MLGAAMLNLAPAWFVKQIVDVAIPRGNMKLLWICCAAMVAGPLVAGLLQVAQKYGAEWIGQQVMLDLRVALYRHLHGMPFAYFTKQKPGEAVSHVLNDVQGVGGVVSNTLIDIVQNSIVLATTLVFVTVLDWRLTVIAVAFLPLFVTPTRRVGRMKKELKRSVQARMAELTGIVTETLSVSGALMIKAFDTQDAEVRRFRHKAEELQDLSLRQSLIGRWFAMILKLFESLGPAMVFGIGGWLVITGQLPLGTVVAFVTVMKKLYSPASDLANVHVDLMTSYAYFDRVFAVLDRTSPLRDEPDAQALSRPIGRIDFQSLSFAYDDDGTALSSIDLAVPAGMTIGVVGPSGAGKSTLASLLMRLYDPTQGAVLVDGVDVRRVTQASLRAHMAVVTQETFLFHTTVLENLRYGHPLATRAQVEHAARRAQIHDLIASLPQGYNTVVGERGYRFSAGERQRLAIARAILKDPRILILDEATSALDSVSERAVQEALAPLLQGRTSLIIAHRLSTVRHADQIVVLNRGRIVERGTHEDLIARRGLYARLWRSQARRDARRQVTTAA